jgi:predicted ATPase/DNA-binding CsgD family transcriptional regulator
MPDAPPPPPDASSEDRGEIIEFARRPHPPVHVPALRLTSFVGREREISDLVTLLDGGGMRLLTLTGPGGAGKTRLASAVAMEVADRFEDGVWWVELAPISDPGLVPQAVARVLSVQETPGHPLNEAIAEDLIDLQMLIVLDNCEHLIETCAQLSDTLLRSCQRLSILATSRETFGVTGERNFPVPPLSSPSSRDLDVAEIEGFESVRLFVERARYRVPDFVLDEKTAPSVAGICARLDGIPLAIELAAARAGTLSVEQISGRLEHSLGLLSTRDRTSPARQRTMRGALDWSYELLDEEERKVLGRLSVFAGGFTLDAAEAVCAGSGIEAEKVLDLLTRLVEKSLVLVAQRSGEARYRLLEPARQYAAEKLRDSGEFQQTRERHARYFLARAEEAERELREQGDWLERLGTEHDNFRAALGWALGSENIEGNSGEERAQLGLRLAASLAQARFWHAYGQGEGRRWLELGLLETDASSDKRLRAKALSQAGYMAIWQGDYQRSATLVEESMALSRDLGDKTGIAASLFHLGQIAVHGGDRERAKVLRLEAEALRRVLEDQQAAGLLLIFLGMAAQDEGDDTRGAALMEEGLTLNRELGDLRGIAMCLTGLGVVALDRRDSERAAALYEEDIRILRQLKDKTGTAYGLRGMACVAALRGEAARAARLWGATEALAENIRLPLSAFDRSHPDYEHLISGVRSRLDDEAAWEAARAEGQAMTPEEALEYALATHEVAPASPKEASAPSSLLSKREAEILTLVAGGLTNPQVAHRLYLSPRTVGQHLRSIYRKLGVSSRAAAAKAAVEHDLI